MVTLWVAAALAAEAEIDAAASALAVGQRIRVTLTVRDGRPSARPDLLVGDGLVADFVSQGRSFQSNGRSFVESSRYDYDVTAVRSGSWPIGPMAIALDGGGVVGTEAIRIDVSEVAPADDGRPLVARAEVLPSSAWEGQVVVYGLRLDSRMEVADVAWRVPDAAGLRPAGGEAEATAVDRVDGPSGPRLSFHAWQALVATGSGAFTLAPSVAELTVPTGRVDFFGLRGSRRDRVATDAVALSVRPLPPPPPEWTGLVGDFDLDARLDRSEASVGDSVRFTVSLVGDGVLDGVSVPLPDLPGVRVYDGDLSVRGTVEGGAWRSVARLTRSLVPTEPGHLQLPPVEWTVFSPASGDYVRLRAEIPPLTVRGVAEAAAVQSFLGDPTEAPVEIDPVPAARGARARWSVGGPLLWGVAAFGLAPGLLRAGRGAWRWSRRPRPTGPKAPATASELLDAVALSSDRLGALDAALRAREAEKLPAEVVGLVREARTALDRARYADGPDPEPWVRRAVQGAR